MKDFDQRVVARASDDHAISTPESRPIVAWGCPKAFPHLHAIVEVDYAVLTRCRGSWPSTDTGEIFKGDAPPPRRKRCGRCAELAGVPADPIAVAPPGVLIDFDMSDLGGES